MKLSTHRKARRRVLLTGLTLALGLLLIGQMPVAQAAPSAAVTLPANYTRIDNGSGSTINTNDDGDSGTTHCTLRDAIASANGGAAINGCSFTTVGSGGPPYVIFTPTGSYTYTLNGTELLHSANALYIMGESAANTVIQADSLDPTNPLVNPVIDNRVFHNTGGDATLSNMTLQHGYCNSACAGLIDVGGGIYNESGSVTLDNATVSNNKATYRGGGIYSAVDLTLNTSTVSGNVAKDEGGGIYQPAGTMTITDSTVSGNTSTSSAGGGIDNYSTSLYRITGSTISGNTAHYEGGGLFSERDSGAGGIIVNSTFSGNTTTNADGGGIHTRNLLYLYNVTITNNSADTAGGLANNDDAAGETHMANTIIAGNSAITSDPDCRGGGGIISSDYNLVQDVTGCNITGTTTHNITGVSANLGSLASNGGPTMTHALNSGSPAIDGGNPAGCVDDSSTLSTDQRGSTRPMDGDGNGSAICDIGAYEAPGVTAVVTATPNFTVTLTASANPTTASVGDTIYWTFVIHNPTNQGTAGLTFRADLPSNLTYVNLTTTSGQLRTPMTLPTIWVDMPGIPPGGDVTVVIETTVNALASASLPVRARVVQQAVKAARHLIQTSSQTCVQGSVATVGAQACVTLLPSELPETGGRPLSPAPWIAAIMAAILLASGGLLLRRQMTRQ